jgi:hypothetical protein
MGESAKNPSLQTIITYSNTEVDNLAVGDSEQVFPCQYHVGGLDVSMEDALRVAVAQGKKNLMHESCYQGFAQEGVCGEGLCQQLLTISSSEVLED